MQEMDLDILINQIAQGLKPVVDLLREFELMPEGERRSFLRRVNAVAIQAGATEVDVSAAIVRSGVRAGRTAAVLLSKGPVGVQLAKLAGLPLSDLADSMRIAIALLGISDERRRRDRCSGRCSHWWHLDLSDELVLDRIRKGEIS